MAAGACHNTLMAPTLFEHHRIRPAGVRDVDIAEGGLKVVHPM